MPDQEERKYMKHIDDLILRATPADLAKIQELDLQTQLDGKSFYDTCIESTIPLTQKAVKPK